MTTAAIPGADGPTGTATQRSRLDQRHARDHRGERQAGVDAGSATVGAATFTEGGAAGQLLDTGAVSDADNPANFDGGNLTVTITDWQPGDELVVNPVSGFTLTDIGPDNSGVLQAGHEIGTLDTTIGGVASVLLTSSATQAVVTQLIQAFGYRSTSDDPTFYAGTPHPTRDVTFAFDDGNRSGNSSSSVVVRQVNVTGV